MSEDGWRLGGRVGGYRLEALLGRGGMGQVFRAVHEESGAVRAVKTLLPGAVPEELVRFAREGEAQAKVDAHPAVARIHGLGSAAGRPFIVLELCGGGSLADRLARGRLGWRAAAELVQRLAAGVAHLHARGVVHRDLKPENVLFDDLGCPKLVDFGLARLAGASSLTASGTVLGTPAFLAPEQASGLPAGQPADVHALGLLLVTCLAGASPFARPTLAATLAAVAGGRAPAPSALDPAAPAELDRLVGACLEKEPSRRPTAAEVGGRLEALLARATDDAGPRWRRWRTPVALALAAGALLGPALALARRREPPATPAPATPAPTTPAPTTPAPTTAQVVTPHADPSPARAWADFKRAFKELRPSQAPMGPTADVRDAEGSISASLAVSPDGSRAAATVNQTARIVDLDPALAPHPEPFQWLRPLLDVAWDGDRAVAVDKGGTLTWAREGGWELVRDGGGAWRIAFDGAARIDAVFVAERPGRDLFDIVTSGRTLVRNVGCSALAARAGRVAILGTFEEGSGRQLLILPVAPPTPSPPPAPIGPRLVATARCLRWLDDAAIAFGTSDGDVFVARDGAPDVELVTPGLHRGDLEEGRHIASQGLIRGLAGAGDRVVVASVDLQREGWWELAAWSVSSPDAPRARLERANELLLALTGTDRRVVALVDRAGKPWLLVFDLPPWPTPGG